MAESLDSGSLREKMSSSAGRAMNKVKSVMAPTSIANAGVAASELIGVVAAGAMATSEQLVSGLSTVGGGISAVGGKVVGGMDVFWKESPEEDALAQVDEKKWNSWSKQQARQGEVEKTKDRLSLQAKMMSASDRSSMGEGEAQDEEGVWLDFVKLERLKAHACEWDRIGRSEENALIDLLDGLPKDPMEMEEVEFDEVVEEYVRLSDAAQRDLADTCRARWGDFKKGLHEVEMLERELSAAKFVCSKGRSSLNLARIQLEEGNVAAHFRKKQVLQEVCALLSQLVQALDREDRAMEALNGRSPDYALARTLSNECYSFIGIAPPHSPSDPLTHVSEVGEEVGRHVSKLLCAQDVATRLSRLEERFDVKVKDGLKELCKNFDKQTFERIFLAYARNGRQWELGESLHGHFLEGLDKGLQQIIFSTVAADAEEDAVTLLTMSFEQLISRIPAEQMVMALLSCYQHMCELLSSLQSVLLYIRKSMRRAERDAVRVLVSQGMSAGGAQKLLEDEKLAIEECMKGAESVVEPPDLSSAGKGSEAGVLQRSASAEGAEEEAQPAEEETPEKEHEADLPPRQSLDVEAPARMSIDESSTAGSAITNTPSAASQGGERVDGEKAGQSSSVWSRLKAARTMLKTGTPSKGEEAAAHAAGSFSDKAGEHKGAQGEKGKAWRSSGISAMSAMAAAATGAGKAAAGAAQSLATHAHIASHSSDERHSSHAAMAAHEANHLQAPSKIKEKLVRGGFMSETGVASARSSSSVSLPSSIWILELLLNGTHISLWDEAQNRVRSLVTLPKINSLRREEYCKLMAATNRFAKFGEELTRLPATLRGTIWSVCRDYYQMFHRSSILMVQTSIESDFWQPYPTGGGGRLNLATVQELRPFIFWEQEGKGGADARTGMQDSVWSEFFGEVEQGERGGGDVKAEEKKGRGEDSIPQNPFSQLSLESFALPPMPKATASEEEDAEGGGMEDGALVPRQVFTGATLKVARLIGEYLHLMRLLPPVAHDAVLGLRELLSYYLLLTADLFTPPDMSTKSVQVGGGMEILRRRGAESMQLLLRHMEAARPVAPLPLLTCQAVLKSPDAFFGLGERCVAIESLLFLVEVMQAVRVSLSQLSVPKSASDVKSIFKEIVEHVEELREMIYSRFPHICISMSDIVNQIAHMKWDSKDLAQRHSQYVDVIHERFLQFFSALDQMRKFLPDEMRPILLRASILHIMENLVEGYSKIRHVGPNTPLLMSNDINTLKSAMEMIPGMEEFGLKPLPFFTHVELFIKGYFLPPDSPQVMVEWAYQHPFYPPHQVLGLVQAVIESNSHHTSSFSALMGQGKSKSTEVKRVLAQVEEAVRTNVSPSASMSLHALAMAR